MIKIGETLPDGVLSEFIAVETEGCSPGPNKFHVADLVKGKKIVIQEGRLGDVAPTILQLLQLPQPKAMTGTSLLKDHAA